MFGTTGLCVTGWENVVTHGGYTIFYTTVNKRKTKREFSKWFLLNFVTNNRPYLKYPSLSALPVLDHFNSTNAPEKLNAGRPFWWPHRNVEICRYQRVQEHLSQRTKNSTQNYVCLLSKQIRYNVFANRTEDSAKGATIVFGGKTFLHVIPDRRHFIFHFYQSTPRHFNGFLVLTSVARAI